jgi:lipid II isoglutaminyl synthase (glutamine-hydrolysing)
VSAVVPTGATPARRRDSAVRIGLLFPALLGTYGDGGNAVVLQKRLQWRGIDAEIVEIEAGTAVPDSLDLYLLGGGEDGPQVEAARELGTDGPVHRAVHGGAVVFAVCAGMQIVGTSFAGKDGSPVGGAGLLDCTTAKTDEPRAVGELLVDVDPEWDLPRLTGFENHGGRTLPGPTARTLGKVEAGVGNGNGTEGVVNTELGAGTVLGTYLHGPGLARNPALADLLLSWVLGVARSDLEPLDDTEAELLRTQRFSAVDRGNLDGVAERSWRDRLFGRN